MEQEIPIHDYSECTIGRILQRYYNRNSRCYIQNVHLFAGGETDFLVITGSGYSHDIEIKISRGDFFTDRKKLKHDYYKAIVQNKTNFFTPRIRRNYSIIGYSSWLKKFRPISPVDNWADGIDWHQVSCMPNRFSYAVPEGLVDVSEVPDYAGLMYIKINPVFHRSEIQVIKNAPLLHKNKFNKWEDLAIKYFYR